MLFDPYKKRQVLSPERGGISTFLDVSPEAADPIGNFASLDLGTIISAWLVGYAEEVSSYLALRFSWLQRALSSGEEFGESQEFHRSVLYSSKAMAQWMIEGRFDPEDWRLAAINLKAYWEVTDSMDAKEVVRAGLDDFLAYCVLSGAFDFGTQTYESYLGHDLPRATKLGPSDWAYSICRAKTSGTWNAQEYLSVGEKVLRKNVESEWLGRGQYKTALMWELVMGQCRISAEENFEDSLRFVLGLYDYMPQVSWPNFLPSREGSRLGGQDNR